MSLGKYIRELRDERGLSLRELAKKLGCSAPFLSDVELGRRYPSEEMLKQIGQALHVSIADLKARDVRAPIEEIKRATERNPRYALAFRSVLEHGIDPEKLLELTKRVRQETEGKKKK